MARDKTQHPLFQIFIILILLVSCYIIYDRINIIVHSDLVPAQITGCESQWVKIRINNSSTLRDQVQYKPKAVTEQGDIVIGSIMLPTRALCAQMVGKEVSVLVNKNDPEQNRIYTFIQFWAISLFILFFPLSLFISRHSIISVRFFSAFFIAGFIGSALYELGTLERYFPLLMTGESLSPSEASLKRCVWASMAEEEVEHRNEVKSLICQDEGISDLNSISDLVNLETLYLQNNHLNSLEDIPSFLKLKVLSIAGNKKISSTKGIEKLVSLEEFQANKGEIHDLSGIEQLSHLRVVGLMMNKITDVSAFSKLSNLEDITLSYNPINDISAFSNKPHLFDFRAHATHVNDISPLSGNKALKIVGVSSDQFLCQQLDELRAQLSSDAKVYGPKRCE